MAVRIREVKNVSVLDVDGNIDINSSEIVEMVGWLVNTGKLRIVLNLENVDLVDYSGLSILAIAYKNVVNHKGAMKLVRVSLPVIELFKVARLDGVFETYADEETAINSFFDDGLSKLKLRRKFQRLDVHVAVRYSIMGEAKNRKAFTGEVLNMSAIGVYIYTPYIFPVNSTLELEFTIPGTGKSLESSGRVAWHADKKLQPHSYPGMGVSFVHLSAGHEKAIMDFIDKNVTHRAEGV